MQSVKEFSKALKHHFLTEALSLLYHVFQHQQCNNGHPATRSDNCATWHILLSCYTAADAEAAGRQPTLSDIQLNPNPHSWSKTAHVLYIDSPAGTGFSYTPGESSYHTNDDKTIDDLEAFVEGFFKEHPWLQRQPLYIAGSCGPWV